MKATAAVLGSCLKILALVDAISLAKVSGSNYNIEWAKIDPYDPNDSLGDIIGNLVQYDPRRASINPLPHSLVGDGLYHRPNHQYEPNYDYISSENVVPLEYVDSRQRESVDNESHLKLKLELKVGFPQPNQLGESVVYEPNYVSDEELQPSWFSHDYHENLPPYPVNAPSVEAYHRIHEISKNRPEYVKNEFLNTFELPQHSSKIPNNVQEMTTESPEIHNETTLETTQVDAYLKKLQQLMDTLNKLKVNYELDQIILPYSENKPALNDITKNTPQTMPEDPIEIATESPEIHNETTLETTQVDAYLKKLQQLMDTLNKLKVNYELDQIILPYSENKPALNDITKNTPQTMPEDPIEIATESPEIHNETTLKTTQVDAYLKKLQQLMDTLNKLKVNYELDQIILPYSENKPALNDITKNIPQTMPDPIEIATEMATESPEIHNETTLETTQVNDETDSEKNTPQTMPEDPIEIAAFVRAANKSESNKPIMDSSPKIKVEPVVRSFEGEQDEPHAELHDDIHEASKDQQRPVTEDPVQLFAEPGPEDTKTTFNLNSSENLSAQDEPLLMLYDAINSGPKATWHTVGNYQTSSRLSEDVLKYQIEKSDRDYLGSGPESEDYQKDEGRRYPKISPPIHQWSNKVPRVETTADELPANTPEYQLTLSDPNEFQNYENRDISAGFVSSRSMSVGVPSDHERTDSNGYSTPFESFTLPADNENDRTTISKRGNSLFTKILSWFG